MDRKAKKFHNHFSSIPLLERGLQDYHRPGVHPGITFSDPCSDSIAVRWSELRKLNVTQIPCPGVDNSTWVFNGGQQKSESTNFAHAGKTCNLAIDLQFKIR